VSPDWLKWLSTFNQSQDDTKHTLSVCFVPTFVSLSTYLCNCCLPNYVTVTSPLQPSTGVAALTELVRTIRPHSCCRCFCCWHCKRRSEGSRTRREARLEVQAPSGQSPTASRTVLVRSCGGRPHAGLGAQRSQPTRHACPYLLVSLSGDGPSHLPPLLEARPSRFFLFVCVRQIRQSTESVSVSCFPCIIVVWSVCTNTGIFV